MGKGGRGVQGSPPRVRGEVSRMLHFLIRPRITPACAGRSRSMAHLRLLPRDHPRVCGEKTRILGKLIPLLGSPPRVRGEVIIKFGIPGYMRITPACAGRSTPVNPWPAAARITPACAGRRSKQAKSTDICRDHPRVCGEKSHAGGREADDRGSPPRVRGEAGGNRQQDWRGGITPACAGRSPG